MNHRLFSAALCVACSMLLWGCGIPGPSNVGTNPPDYTDQFPPLTAAISVPAGMIDGNTAQWTANFSGGLGPYAVTWNFGLGANPQTIANTGLTGTSNMVTVRMAEGTYTATLTVVDLLDQHFTTTASYTVAAKNTPPPPPPPPTHDPPVINSATFDTLASQLVVTASSPEDGETLTVQVTPPAAGFNLEAQSKVASATGPLTARFSVTAVDPLLGAEGDFSIRVSDSQGSLSDVVAVHVKIDALVIPTLNVPADTLVVVPVKTATVVNGPVIVMVATGVPANAFQYMVGVGVTIESDADYVPNSFNVGAVGGLRDTVDGYWAAMNPTSGFLLGPDGFIVASDIGGGRERWDFNLTPLGGSSLTTAEGVLFNVNFKFNTPGVKTFGLQESLGVKRTYYSDSNTEFYWGDITNDGTVAANSVTVN